MTYIDRIKRIFFTSDDLGFKILDDELRERESNERIIREGAQSQLLMQNTIFQDVVADMYLNLEAQLDFIEDTDNMADEQIRWVRLQRRALRQVCAVLDTKIATMEALQKALKEEQQDEKS